MLKNTFRVAHSLTLTLNLYLQIAFLAKSIPYRFHFHPNSIPCNFLSLQIQVYLSLHFLFLANSALCQNDHFRSICLSLQIHFLAKWGNPPKQKSGCALITITCLMSQLPPCVQQYDRLKLVELRSVVSFIVHWLIVYIRVTDTRRFFMIRSSCTPSHSTKHCAEERMLTAEKSSLKTASERCSEVCTV